MRFDAQDIGNYFAQCGYPISSEDISPLIYISEGWACLLYTSIDGKLFINQVDEAGKDYWLKEAGGFKKYCEACKIGKEDENLCPCKEYRDTGHCRCTLYKNA